MMQKRSTTLLQRFPKEYFAADSDRSKCLHATSSNALFFTHYVGNVIFFKFSHDDISYRFNGKNVNAMLELWFLKSGITRQNLQNPIRYLTSVIKILKQQQQEPLIEIDVKHQTVYASNMKIGVL